MGKDPEPEDRDDPASAGATDSPSQDPMASDRNEGNWNGICPRWNILLWAPVLSPVLPVPWPAAAVMPWPLWTPFLFEQPADLSRPAEAAGDRTSGSAPAELLPAPRCALPSRCPKPIHRNCPIGALTCEESARSRDCSASRCRLGQDATPADEEACITVQGQRLCIRTAEALIECERLVLDQRQGVIRLQGQVCIQPRKGGARLHTEGMCIELPSACQPAVIRGDEPAGLQPAGQCIPAAESGLTNHTDE